MRPRQMQEDGAASAGDARARIVVDLDDEIIQMIVTPKPVPALAVAQSEGLVVTPVGGILAPRIGWPDATNRQQRPRPWMAVCAPPQPARPKCASRGAAIALPLVGQHAAPAERHGNDLAREHEPAPPPIAG